MYDLPSLLKLARKDTLLRGLISEEISHEVARENLRNNNLPKSDRIASTPSNEWAKTQVLCKVASSEPISDLIDSRAFPQGSNELAVRVLKKAYPQGNALENHLIKVAQLCMADEEVFYDFGEQVHFQLFKKAAFEGINFDPRNKRASSVRWARMFFALEDYIEDSISKTADEALTKSTMKKEDVAMERGMRTKQQKSQGKKEEAKLQRQEQQKSGKALLNRYKQQLLDDKASSGMKNKILKTVYKIIGKKSPALKEKKDQLRIKWDARKKEKVKVKFKNPAGKDRETEVKIETTNNFKQIQNPDQQSKYEKIWRKEYGKFISALFSIANRAMSGGGGKEKKEDSSKPSDSGAESKSDSGADSGGEGKSEGGGEKERSWDDTGLDAQTIKEMKAEGKTPDEALAMVYGEGEGQEDEPTSDAEAQVVDSQSEVSFEASPAPAPAPAKKSRKQKKYEAKGGQGNWKDNKKSRTASEEEEPFEIEF